MAQQVENALVLGAVTTREEAEAQANAFGRLAVRIVEVRPGTAADLETSKPMAFFVWPKVSACPCCHRDGLPDTKPAAEVEGAPV